MQIYPAIDIYQGRCVRLKQGDFQQVTVYNENPAEQAKRWCECGCSYIHVVDLNSAREGGSRNKEALRQIVKAVSVPIQTGGGIRTLADAEKKIGMGVSRVILGTTAILEPNLLREICERLGSDRVVAGIDARNGFAAVSGWEETKSKTALECCLEMKAMGVKTIVYTDISKDGMMQGPNVDATADLIERTGLSIIASGGVSRIEDLYRLQAVGASGVIIGQALYTGAIDLAQAVSLFEKG